MSDWSSKQYLKFKAQRTQPAIDLVNRIEYTDPAAVLDVGCGPGNSTEILHEAYPNASILGIDRSKNMIESARSAYPHLTFLLRDAQTELAGWDRKFDIVFSNACLQWIPDHPVLLRTLMALLKEGGILAVQIPMNTEEPIHRILQDVASQEEWREKIGKPRFFYTLSPYEYDHLLSELSQDVAMWRTTYFHRLHSHQEIMEWYRGTGMRPYLDALSEKDQGRFEEEVYRQVVSAYPKQKNGTILFPFPRFFFTAVR